MSKGSKRRPKDIDEKEFTDNWDKVFGKKPKKNTHKEWQKQYEEDDFYNYHERVK